MSRSESPSLSCAWAAARAFCRRRRTRRPRVAACKHSLGWARQPAPSVTQAAQQLQAPCSSLHAKWGRVQAANRDRQQPVHEAAHLRTPHLQAELMQVKRSARTLSGWPPVARAARSCAAACKARWASCSACRLILIAGLPRYRVLKDCTAPDPALQLAPKIERELYCFYEGPQMTGNLCEHAMQPSQPLAKRGRASSVPFQHEGHSNNRADLDDCGCS